MIKRLALVLVFVVPALAGNQEKAEKKALEQQAKAFVLEAKVLEKGGKLLEARSRYAKSQSFLESKDALEAIKRIDTEIHSRVKAILRQAHQTYDRGEYKAAALLLETGAKLGGSNSAFSYNLALCNRRLGDHATALGQLDEAANATADPKRKLKIRQLRTALVTGETPSTLKDENREAVNRINQLLERIGFEASLEDGSPSLHGPLEGTTPTASVPLPKLPMGSLCQALAELKGPVAQSPSVTFNLANCAEDNDRPADAARLLGRYLESAPTAADGDRVRLRIAKLNTLAGLPGDPGTQVRNRYAAASRFMQQRRYADVLTSLQHAALAAPDFAQTEWRLALMFEAMGDVDQARVHFAVYRNLELDPAGRQEADLHLETLEVKRSTYDEEVERASDLLSDLFNRAMNLTFNGLEDRASQYKQRAKDRAKDAMKHKVSVVGGFTVPFAYAQQQLAEAGQHLSSALLLFPLGAEANQLMGLVFLQANDGRSSMRSFDAVASQNLPVAFYAEMRGRNRDHAVKCELTGTSLRLIFLSSYDKKAKPTAPGKPAGEDGLGDLTIDPRAERQQNFESLTLTAAEIRGIQTKNGHLVVKLAKEEITLSPIYLPAYTPSDGPAGRRFGNSYTRLFVRYPGLEESKLGTEGLTGFEKVKLGYDIANAAFGIAGGLNPIGAASALQEFISITREVQGVAKSLHVTFAGWIRTIEDQQELQAGNSYKPIPTEAVALSFLEEIK